jgi:hypothetical protein
MIVDLLHYQIIIRGCACIYFRVFLSEKKI